MPRSQLRWGSVRNVELVRAPSRVVSERIRSVSHHARIAWPGTSLSTACGWFDHPRTVRSADTRIGQPSTRPSQAMRLDLTRQRAEWPGSFAVIGRPAPPGGLRATRRVGCPRSRRSAAFPHRSAAAPLTMPLSARPSTGATIQGSPPQRRRDTGRTARTGPRDERRAAVARPPFRCAVAVNVRADARPARSELV
jgi:hypothetical protein